MSDIEDLADITHDDEPLDRAHLNRGQSAAGLKSYRKGIQRRANEMRGAQLGKFSTAPISLPRLKFLENGSDD